MATKQKPQEYRDLPLRDWWTPDGQPVSRDDIIAGCLLRISDGIDKVAKNFRELEASRDEYHNMWMKQREAIKTYKRQIAALRGEITKLKKRARLG